MYKKQIYSDFTILNDLELKDLGLLLNFFSSYYKTQILELSYLIDILLTIIPEEINEGLFVGEGGLYIQQKLNTRKYQGISNQIHWNIKRVWLDEKPDFLYNEISLPNSIKELYIIDDVLASGKTLEICKKIIDPENKIKFNAIVLIKSSRFKNILRGYDKLLFCVEVEPIHLKKGDLYWFPAIYSMRHLLFKNEEYLNRLIRHYFNENAKKLKHILIRMRKEWKKEF